jgi:hypothetical protein
MLNLRALVFDGILRLRESEPRYRELLELSSCARRGVQPRRIGGRGYRRGTGVLWPSLQV